MLFFIHLWLSVYSAIRTITVIRHQKPLRRSHSPSSWNLIDFVNAICSCRQNKKLRRSHPPSSLKIINQIDFVNAIRSRRHIKKPLRRSHSPSSWNLIDFVNAICSRRQNKQRCRSHPPSSLKILIKSTSSTPSAVVVVKINNFVEAIRLRRSK